eukprot:5772483-Pyramimonas_sp.AAC.1
MRFGVEAVCSECCFSHAARNSIGSEGCRAACSNNNLLASSRRRGGTGKRAVHVARSSQINVSGPP